MLHLHTVLLVVLHFKGELAWTLLARPLVHFIRSAGRRDEWTWWYDSGRCMGVYNWDDGARHVHVSPSGRR